MDSAARRFVVAKARQLLAALVTILLTQAAKFRSMLQHAVAKVIASKLNNAAVPTAPAQRTALRSKTVAVHLFDTRCVGKFNVGP